MKECDVNLSFNSKEPPILLNITNEKNITIIKYPRNLKIQENEKLFAVCPGGMTIGDSSDSTTKSSIGNSSDGTTKSSTGDSSDSTTKITRRRRRQVETTTELPIQPGETAPEDTTTQGPVQPQSKAQGNDGDEDEDGKKTYVNLTLTCVDSVINGITKDGTTLPNVVDITCKNESRFDVYQKVGFGSCSHNYYSLGIKVFENIYEFMQICFDFRNMLPIFVRFIGQQPPSLLNEYISKRALDMEQIFWDIDKRYKTGFERNLARNNISVYIDLELPNYNFFISSSKYEELVEQKFGKHSKIVHYHEVDLYPTIFGKLFKGIIPNQFHLQTTIGWDALFKGNWPLFLESLYHKTLSDTYEIYIGISHIAVPPVDKYSIEEKDLILKDNGKELAIPQFIWAYVFSLDERFVVIGVNTPYYPIWDNTNLLPCKLSSCDYISGFQNLARLQNISTLGLIYCCAANTVSHFLEGFPKV